MIIPVRCMTCGKVLADKWDYYQKRCKEIASSEEASKENDKSSDIVKKKYFEGTCSGKVLDELQLTKMCCRRHMLGHVDLIEII